VRPVHRTPITKSLREWTIAPKSSAHLCDAESDTYISNAPLTTSLRAALGFEKLRYGRPKLLKNG
jgi:hypothetical protein